MGAGGKITFPRTPNQGHPAATSEPDSLDRLDYVGTLGCYTCAGVFFRIDEARCCPAHTHAMILGDEKDVDEGKGEAARQKTLESLSAETEQSNWRPDSHYNIPSLVMFCSS